MIRWKVWMSYYEPPERPDTVELWRRKFPVHVVARTQEDAFEQAVKIAKDSVNQDKYSIAVLNGEYGGLTCD